MPIFRINASGTLTSVRLGRVQDGGVDFGSGVEIANTSVRLQSFRVLGYPTNLPPTSVRLHNFRVNAVSTDIVGTETFARLHKFYVVSSSEEVPFVSWEDLESYTWAELNRWNDLFEPDPSVTVVRLFEMEVTGVPV